MIDYRAELLSAVTRTLNEAADAVRYADSTLRHAKDAQAKAQAAYDLVIKMIQAGRVLA